MLKPKQKNGRERAGKESLGRETVRPTALMSLTEFLETKRLSGEVEIQLDHTMLSLTHLEKPYWSRDGITKGDLLKYYAWMAPKILPYLYHRPLILKRYPNGVEKEFFYQHDLSNAPDFVRTQSLESAEGRIIDYVLVENTASLLYLTNLGTIEQHPWHSRVEDITHPDWVVFDLDPKDAEFKMVCEAAQTVRSVLGQLGLQSYAKTSGSRGIHVFIPIEPRYSYVQIARFAEGVAASVAKENPECVTVVRSLDRRLAGHVYIDHLQNAKGKTIAAPYSVRARAGATVSAPLEWAEVKKDLVPQQFTLMSMPERIREKGDLFKGVLDHPQSLDAALDRMKKQREIDAHRTKRTRPYAYSHYSSLSG